MNDAIFFQLTQRRSFGADDTREEKVLINVNRVVHISPNTKGCRLILSGAQHALDVIESYEDVCMRLGVAGGRL